MSSSAGQDRGSCGYFTLNFGPASVKYFVEKRISTTAFYFVLQLLLCGYLQRTTVSWPCHHIKYFRREFPSYLQRMHRLHMTSSSPANACHMTIK